MKKYIKSGAVRIVLNKCFLGCGFWEDVVIQDNEHLRYSEELIKIVDEVAVSKSRTDKVIEFFEKAGLGDEIEEYGEEAIRDLERLYCTSIHIGSKYRIVQDSLTPDEAQTKGNNCHNYWFSESREYKENFNQPKFHTCTKTGKH